MLEFNMTQRRCEAVTEDTRNANTELKHAF